MGRYTTHTAWIPSTGASYLIPGVESSGITTNTVTQAETRAQSMVEGYLGKRYTIPLTQCALVATLVEDVTTYNIFRYLTTLNRDVQNAEAIRVNYDDSLALLKDIIDGKVELHDAAGNRITERSLANKYHINTNGYASTFNLDKETSWTMSPNRLDAIADLRESDG